jgi:hypothetical protein
MNLPDLLQKHDAGGDRFAKDLRDFIKHPGDFTFVETGFGVSTLFILQAMDRLGNGRLYSVDPSPWFQDEVNHPRHTLVKGRSSNSLVDVYARSGPWTYFLHDSNHDVECMTYELNFAYACLEPLGYLFCDDYTWNGHGAWQTFCKERGLTPTKMGSLEYVQAPYDAMPPTLDELDDVQAWASNRAIEARDAFYASGGSDSGVFG